MLWQDITASGVLDTGLQESVSGRELWPSSVVLLDAAAGDGYLPFCTENDAAQIGEEMCIRDSNTAGRSGSFLSSPVC